MSKEDKTKKAAGVGAWFSALLGKSPQVGGLVKTQPPKTDGELSVTDLSKEDSVKEDFALLGKFLAKFKSKADKKVAPLKEAGSQKLDSLVGVSGDISDKPFYKNLLKIFFSVFILLILIFVGATLFNTLKGERREAPVAGELTPTPIPFEPTAPSVYAKDEVILQMEEDISVLEKELARVTLRENNLNPPRLDFNVNF